MDDSPLEVDAPVGFLPDGSAQAAAIGATLTSTTLEGDVPLGGQFGAVGSLASKTGRARELILDARLAGDHGAVRPENPENLDHIDGQIVDRDYKLVAQSETVVVYYPTTTLSAGVICEMKEAIHRGKRVYALWLPDQPPSPFFTRYCTRWFRSEDALFDYMDEAGVAPDRSSTSPGAALPSPAGSTSKRVGNDRAHHFPADGPAPAATGPS